MLLQTEPTLSQIDAEIALRQRRPKSPAEFAAIASRGKWKRARHLDLLNEKLLDLASGKIKRLIVTMPPRHGKSELCSKYFPAWFVGCFRDNQVILCSYEAELAASWGGKVRDLLEEYGKEWFDVAVRQDSRARNDWRVEGRDGGMRSAGVGGPITGKGCQLFIIDDPIKNAEEAASKTYRDKTWDWWQSTALTRLEPDASVLVIHTRWHEDDLIGRLLADSKDDDGSEEKWEVLNLPAIAEENDQLGRDLGEALWPERWPKEKLEKRKPKLGSYVWAALYQQRPSPGDGGKFKRDWFLFYTTEEGFYRLHRGERSWLVHPDECTRIATLDTASSEKQTADYSSLQVWDIAPSFDMVLAYRWSDRVEIPQVLIEAARMYRQHDVERLGVEKAAAGIGVFQMLKDKGLTVIALRPKGDKLQRAQTAMVRAEAGQVHLPKNAEWVGDWIEQMAAFPNVAHDDDVDAFSYAALMVHKMGGTVLDDDDREDAEKKQSEQDLEDDATKHPGASVLVATESDDSEAQEWLKGQ